MRCEWCQEESFALVPVVNRDITVSGEHVLLCLACLEVERFEHADELLWSPVNFADLVNGRLRKAAA